MKLQPGKLYWYEYYASIPNMMEPELSEVVYVKTLVLFLGRDKDSLCYLLTKDSEIITVDQTLRFLYLEPIQEN